MKKSCVRFSDAHSRSEPAGRFPRSICPLRSECWGAPLTGQIWFVVIQPDEKVLGGPRARAKVTLCQPNLEFRANMDNIGGENEDRRFR